MTKKPDAKPTPTNRFGDWSVDTVEITDPGDKPLDAPPKPEEKPKR